ncbi:uncharacterized protein JCM15063_001340 [Sporobolomyces koalae]|uniref:uncharacterized protein n=1 Tax=Sporobolomyces koalae TaxID=500713 RepID=UPI003180F755
MTTPRVRTASTTSTWPHLSLLAVYSSTPLLERDAERNKLSDEQLEAAKILYFRAPTMHDLTDERKRRLLGTVMGVADFAKMMTRAEPNQQIQSVKSSKRRMVWIEPEDGILIHATIALPRASSASARRHAREPSTATTASARSSQDSSRSVPLDDQILLSSLRLAYRQYRLLHGSIAASLDRVGGKDATMQALSSFWDEWSEQWNFAVDANQDDYNVIYQVLNGLVMSPLLTPTALAQLEPLLAQFSASNPLIAPILTHSSSELVHLPLTRPGYLDRNTAETLVRHMIKRSSTRIPPIVGHASSQASIRVGPAETSEPSSLSHWSSYLDPRNVPLSSLTSSFLNFNTSVPTSLDQQRNELRRDFEQLRQTTRKMRTTDRSDSDAIDQGSLRSKKEARSRTSTSTSTGSSATTEGANWASLRSVSNGWKRFGAAFTSPTPPLPERPSSAEAIQPETITSNEPEQEETSIEVQPAELGGSTATTVPGTPAVELAPLVDEHELREALSKGLDELQVTAQSAERDQVENDPAAAETPTAEDNNGVDGDANEVLEFFGGEKGDERFQVRLVDRGPLTLALAFKSFEPTEQSPFDFELLMNRASRLLEAIETIFESAPPASVPSTSSLPESVLRCDSLIYSQIRSNRQRSASSDSRFFAAQETRVETTIAFLDAHRALELKPTSIVESLTRLAHSSNWFHLSNSCISSTLSEPPATLTTTNEEKEKEVRVMAILPAKTPRGKDMTLVEAAEGARRIERNWISARGGM